MMTIVAIVFLMVLQPVQPLQATFTGITYCHEYSAGPYEKQCVDLKPDGTGQSRLKRRGGEETPAPLTLSPSGREKLLSVIAGTRNLADRQKYETTKKVANLGRKRIVLEMPSETREADFNYSDLKEVNALATFFDGLLNQQTFALDFDAAAQYDRLSIPERLDRLEAQLKVGQIGDPQGLIPVLDKIIKNGQILEYARQHAEQLKNQLLISK
jgi:hypothetical protein